MNGARWALCGLLALVGCADGVALSVDVRTDFVPGPEFRAVRVTLVGEGETNTIDAAGDYLSGQRAIDLDGLEKNSARVVSVELLDTRGAVVAERSALVNHRVDRGITLTLTRDCASVMCPGAGAAAATACFGGRCTEPACIDGTEPSCPEPECNVDADCPMLNACSTRRCIDTLCLYAPSVDACEAGAYCSPELGCVPLPSALDASMDATPMLDAGLDSDATDALVRDVPDVADSGALNTQCARSLGSGRLHHCLVSTRDRLFCWGENTLGQLGDGTRTQQNRPVQVMDGIRHVAGGRRSTCAATTTGRRACFGENDTAQLGSGSTSAAEPMPLVDATPGGYQVMAQGAVHGCGLIDTGDVLCWGSPSSGRVGFPSAENVVVPTMVPGLGRTVILAAGGSTTCAAEDTGDVRCWGSGGVGICGQGALRDCLVPTLIPELEGASALSARDGHGCAAVEGAVFCWGTNDSGESGQPAGAPIPSPQQVPGIAGAVGVAMGNLHSCALLSSGIVECWGSNANGELGDGTQTTRHTPMPVMGLANVVEISSASFSTCARLTSGEVRCWGRNVEGQLASESLAAFSPLPVPVGTCSSM